MNKAPIIKGAVIFSPSQNTASGAAKTGIRYVKTPASLISIVFCPLIHKAYAIVPEKTAI